MNAINNWSSNKKLLLTAIWIFGTVGRVAYVSLDVPGEAMTMFVITAIVLTAMAGLFYAFGRFTKRQQMTTASAG